MITNDPYGISHAVRPWDPADAKKPVIRRRVKQSEIDMCLNCDLDPDQCFGKCTRRRKKPQEKENPCQRCYSAEVCQRVGGTCNEKEVDGVKVLVACEESQEVCKAFRELGHEAYSCDIEPCSGGHPEWHLQVDALELLKIKWDLIIAHPPCTYMTNAGAVRMRVNGEESVMRTNEARLAWNTRAPILSTEEMEMLDAKD